MDGTSAQGIWFSELHNVMSELLSVCPAMAALRQDARNVRKQTLFLEKHKIVTTKSFYITSDGLIQTFRFYLIHLSQVKIKHHFLPPDGVDLTLHQGQQIFFLLLFSIISNLKVTQNYGAKIVQIHYG